MSTEKIFDDSKAESLERFLNEKGITHLSVRSYGNKFFFEFEENGKKQKLMKMEKDTVYLYRLYIYNHKGKAEYTYMRDLPEKLVKQAMEELPWIFGF